MPSTSVTMRDRATWGSTRNKLKMIWWRAVRSYAPAALDRDAVNLSLNENSKYRYAVATFCNVKSTLTSQAAGKYFTPPLQQVARRNFPINSLENGRITATLLVGLCQLGGKVPFQPSQRTLDFMRCVLPKQRRYFRVHLPIRAIAVFRDLSIRRARSRHRWRRLFSIQLPPTRVVSSRYLLISRLSC